MPCPVRSPPRRAQPNLRLEPLQQSLDIFAFEFWPIAFAKPLSELAQDLAHPGRVDFIRYFHRCSEIRPFRALGPSKRIKRRIFCATELAGHPVAQLLGHRLRALAQLFERTRLLARRVAQIAAFECAPCILHRPARAIELSWWTQTEPAQFPLKTAELAFEVALTLAELTSTLTLLPLALLLLTLLALLPLPALLLTWLSLAALSLGAVGVVHQALLFADDLAELVHHAHHLLALLTLALTLLTRHAAGLQTIEQIT